MTMEFRIHDKSTGTAASRWMPSPFWKRAPRRRRRDWASRTGETLEARTLLSAMPAAEFSGIASDSPSSASTLSSRASQSSGASLAWGQSSSPRAAAPAAAPARPDVSPGGAASAPGIGTRQRFVEVLVFIDSGPLEIGHADIALTDGHGTTVYGQHGVGQGNGGFEDSAFLRRSLDLYLRQEAGSGFKVHVARVPVTEQQFREIREYLDGRWQVDDDFHLTDDNCSQNVGYVLKRWDLLEDWKGGPNVINDDRFQFPEGDLYDDFIRGDTGWDHLLPGYLKTTPGGPSLFESVQNTPPPGTSPAAPGGSSGSSSGGGGQGSSSVLGVPDDGGEWDGIGD